MKAIEFENEVAFVAQTIGLAQEGFDLVVDAFHPAIVNAVFPPGEYATGVAQQRFAQLHHLANAGLGGPVAPFMEEGFHPLEGRLFPEQSQCLLEEVPASVRLMIGGDADVPYGRLPQETVTKLVSTEKPVIIEAIAMRTETAFVNFVYTGVRLQQDQQLLSQAGISALLNYGK